jgi:two-component system alkaline phosphatase synthesis response regulator PhoP
VSESSRILVVDDEQDLSDLLAYRLRRNGFQVDTLDQGTQVMEVAQQRSYQVFVLDVMMPGMKGLELCALLREDWRTQQSGILVCSALGHNLSRQAVLDAGGDDYLPKPLDLEAFDKRVDQLAQRAQKAAARLSYPRFGLDLDAGFMHLDQRLLPVEPLEAVLLKALGLFPEGEWVKEDRLASLLWSLGHMQDTRPLRSLLQGLQAKTRQSDPTKRALVEFNEERGIRFNPR